MLTSLDDIRRTKNLSQHGGWQIRRLGANSQHCGMLRVVGAVMILMELETSALQWKRSVIDA